jgi:hypothetical protein
MEKLSKKGKVKAEKPKEEKSRAEKLYGLP